MPTNQELIEFMDYLQAMCHKIGARHMILILAEVFYRAASDTEDFENLKISETYQALASAIYDLSSKTLQSEGRV